MNVYNVIIFVKHVKDHQVNVQVVIMAIIYLPVIHVWNVKAHVKHVLVKIYAIPVLIIIF